VALTYLSRPTWQKRFPQALTALGQDEFKRWLRRLCPAWTPQHWLDRVDLGSISPPDNPGQADQLAVNVVGYFCYQAGLGEAVRLLDEGLSTVGVRTVRRAIAAPFEREMPRRTDYLGLEPHPITVLLAPPSTPVQQCYHLARLNPRKGVYRI